MTVYRIPVPSVLRAAFPTNGLRAEMERAMDEVFAPRTEWPLPAADAREDATSFTLELDLPGVAAEHVEVTAEEGVLTIRAERRAREVATDERFVIAERAYGKVERRFRLPKTADQNAITASFTNGVLTVRIAKLVPAQPRRVPISVNVAAPTPSVAETSSAQS